MKHHSHWACCIFKECEKIREDAADNHIKDIENQGLFSILDRIPQIGQTKVFLFHVFIQLDFSICNSCSFYWCFSVCILGIQLGPHEFIFSLKMISLILKWLCLYY